MARINELYAVGDLEGLEMVFEEGPRVAACPFSNKADYRDWLRSRVVRLKQRILGLEENLAGLTGSDLAVLRNRIADAQREGRDLLAEMAKDWEAQITKQAAGTRWPGATHEVSAPDRVGLTPRCACGVRAKAMKGRRQQEIQRVRSPG